MCFCALSAEADAQVEVIGRFHTIGRLLTTWCSGKAPASRLLGPVFDALFELLVNLSLPTHFNCPSEQGVGGLEGHTVLPALQPVPYPSRPCGEEHGRLVHPGV